MDHFWRITYVVNTLFIDDSNRATSDHHSTNSVTGKTIGLALDAMIKELKSDCLLESIIETRAKVELNERDGYGHSVSILSIDKVIDFYNEDDFDLENHQAFMKMVADRIVAIKKKYQKAEMAQEKGRRDAELKELKRLKYKYDREDI